jgi:signal transduction histidine kinase/CheY-like chemotaxis protein
VVLARQRARQIATLLGFETREQTAIATAVSEIARNLVEYGGGGIAEFTLDGDPARCLRVRLQDRGPGIADLQAVLDGRYTSPTGMGLGIVGARRLMDRFEIRSAPDEGTTVVLQRDLPVRARVTPGRVREIGSELARLPPDTPLAEVQQQNQELVRILADLRERQTEIERLNGELQETNRGVLALYAELDDKANALQEASEVKSRFLSYMSHEFRTPLNSINSLSRLLLDRVDGPLSPEQEKQVTFIRRCADTLTEMVNDLLDLAKIEAGMFEVHPSHWEPHELLAAMRGIFRPLVTSPSVALLVDAPEDLPSLYTDEGKAGQILRNLVSNAIKFTEAGTIRVTAEDCQGRITFTVADTGIGISPEHHEHVFEEFSQVQSAIQKKVRGTGLGLPLSRRLAELLGGELTLESELGRGATFRLTIPLVCPGCEAEAAGPPADDRTPVLVLDCAGGALPFYEQALQGTELRMVPARTARHARALLHERRAAAAVLCASSSEDPAWQVAAELKAATTECPLLIVADEGERERALRLGADDFHAWPLDRSRLLERLGTLTGGGDQKTVLIIDDDEISRYILRDLLEGLPCRILEASSGKLGLERAQTELPDVVFLDLMMPDVTGSEVLAALRSHPRTRELPVIIMTSRLLSDEERAHLEQSATAVLSKTSSRPREAAAAEVRQVLAGILDFRDGP